MPLSDFDFDLPPGQVAQYPAARRRDARLLVLGGDQDKVNEPGPNGHALRDAGIADLPGLLNPGDLLVLNDTRVIPARLFGHKESGGVVEILIERMLADGRAWAHVRASKSPRPGTRLLLEPTGELCVVGRDDDLFLLEVPDGGSLAALLEISGHTPLPPYITRADEAQDAERYQTVYAERPGAVAAPTAGLHLDTAMLSELEARGVALAKVTLHVAAGTFRPVRGEDIDAHVMHAEHCDVSAETCRAVAAAHADGRRVVAIGTTVTRALEAAARGPQGLAPFSGDTRLFIREGFEFRVVDVLLTNFHLPRSTLLMLVCAFGGYARVMAAYRHALARGYRFFSYGDAMWLQRERATPAAVRRP